MPRIAPLARDDLAEFEPFFQIVEQAMGFVPASLLTMGRNPELLRSFAGLTGTVLAGSRLPADLVQLVAFVASRAAGCAYCQAHTAHGAHRAGVSTEKLDAAFDVDRSPLFDGRERAALGLARDAALVPNAVRDAHFDALREHFSEEEIVDLVAVISLFGWLNRWNDSVATELEASPRAFARNHLAPHGWDAGKHGR